VATGVNVDFKLLGAVELERAFKQLPPASEKKVVRSALRKAAKRIRKVSESLIPRGPDKPEGQHLADVGLKVRALKRSRKRVGVLILTPTRGELGIGATDKSYYPAHLELGHRGVPAHPYMRDAMHSHRSAELAQIGRDIGAGIEREARRLGKKK